MSGKGAFREIVQDDVPHLLYSLRQDMPNSIHAYTFLSVMQAWKTSDKNLKYKLLALNGDFRTKMILFYWLTSDDLDYRGAFHKWTHRDDDTEIMTEALKISDLQIKNVRSAEITGLTPETSKAVIPALKELWGRHKMNVVQEFVFWVPREEVLAWSAEIPEGTELRHLNKSHSKDIMEHWPWKSEDPEMSQAEIDMYATVIQNNFGIGLFDESADDLVAWEVQTYYGAMGALQTMENHRRKGYAKSVNTAVSKEIARRGYDVYSLVVTDNIASIAMHNKMKYRVAFICTTIDYIN